MISPKDGPRKLSSEKKGDSLRILSLYLQAVRHVKESHPFEKEIQNASGQESNAITSGDGGKQAETHEGQRLPNVEFGLSL